MAKKKAIFPPPPKPIPVEALRWTDPVAPDVPPPSSSQDLSKGFLPNSYSMRVEPACSSAVSHAFGRDDSTTSQGSRHLFSTRLLALRAMRHDVEKEAAAKLAAIDERIADEIASVDSRAEVQKEKS